MECPYCNSSTKVVNSRSRPAEYRIWRRRSCTKCHAIWTTKEVIDVSSTHRIQLSAPETAYKPLERDEILFMVKDSLSHRKEAQREASALTNTIMAAILSEKQPVISEQSLHNHIYRTLQRYDPTSAQVFAARFMK